MKITVKLLNNVKNKKRLPICIKISKDGKGAYISTGIYLNDTKDFVGKDGIIVAKTVQNSNEINAELQNLLYRYIKKIDSVRNADNMTCDEIKAFLLTDTTVPDDELTFLEYARRQAETYRGNSQKLMYHTINHLEDFFTRPMYFEDITAGVLRKIDEKWAETMTINTRGIYFRNIRAIFNRAIDDEITTNYPFRKFKIKSTAKKKHELPVECLRKLAQLTFAPSENLKELARDLFMLSFLLCGVNLKDIYNWKKNKLKNGKICFVRYKIRRFEPETVEITLQPEAQALLDKYCGKEYLFSFAETYPNYDTFIGNVDKRIRLLRKDIDFDELTLYYARYSWATIAYKCGVDEKTISKSLGHQDTTVAGKFYILYDWSLTDNANRRVIDYVFK